MLVVSTIKAIPGKSVKLVHNYILKLVHRGVRDHTLKIGPVVVPASERPVDILAYYVQPFAFGVGVALAKLPLNALLLLAVRGIAGIYDRVVFILFGLSFCAHNLPPLIPNCRHVGW